MATVNEKMTAIADEVRALSGTSDALGLDAMATNIESANTEVGAQTDLLAQVATALETKGINGYNTGYRDATNKYRPSFLESGKLIQVDIVEGYPIKATTTLEESDTGYDSITVGYFGKNLFDYTKYPFTNHYIANGSGIVYGSTGYSCTGFIPCSHLQGQTITLNHPPKEAGGGNPGMGFYSDTFNWVEEALPEGIWLGDGGAGNGYTATVPVGANYFRFSVPRAYADGTQIQIELGNTVTEYEAYNGKEISSSFSSTVYSGTYDWDTGKFTNSDGAQYLASCVIGALNGITNIYSTAGTTTIINRTDIDANMEAIANSAGEVERSAFWDEIQNYGARTWYEYAFGYWDMEYIRPKYKVVPTGCRDIYMFTQNKRLKIVEKKYFDLSNITVAFGATSTSAHYCSFYKCSNLEIVEDIGMPAAGYYSTFNRCSKLHTIEVMRVTEESGFDTVFTNCAELVNLTIEGTIGQNGLDLSYSPKLSHDSLMSIINALKDYSGSGTTHTVTLGSTNLAKLTTAEKAIATNRGWTLA